MYKSTEIITTYKTFSTVFYFRYIILCLHILQVFECWVQQANTNSRSPCSFFE